MEEQEYTEEQVEMMQSQDTYEEMVRYYWETQGYE